MQCKFCNKVLEKDEIALSKKLLGRRINEFLCIICLAEYIDCSEDDLITKIEEFREQGCTLFR